MRPDDKRGHTFAAPDRDEDVFGPIDFLCADNKKDVGAIGDGRKRASPDTVDDVNSIFCMLPVGCMLMRRDPSISNSFFVHLT